MSFSFSLRCVQTERSQEKEDQLKKIEGMKSETDALSQKVKERDAVISAKEEEVAEV